MSDETPMGLCDAATMERAIELQNQISRLTALVEEMRRERATPNVNWYRVAADIFGLTIVVTDIARKIVEREAGWLFWIFDRTESMLHSIFKYKTREELIKELEPEVAGEPGKNLQADKFVKGSRKAGDAFSKSIEAGNKLKEYANESSRAVKKVVKHFDKSGQNYSQFAHEINKAHDNVRKIGKTINPVVKNKTVKTAASAIGKIVDVLDIIEMLHGDYLILLSLGEMNKADDQAQKARITSLDNGINRLSQKIASLTHELQVLRGCP